MLEEKIRLFGFHCKNCGTRYTPGTFECPKCAASEVTEEDAFDAREENKQRDAEIAKYKEEQFEKAIFRVIKGVGILIAVLLVASIVKHKREMPLSNGMAKKEADTVFDQGRLYYEHQDYENAINTLCQIPYDSKHYDDARTMLESAEDEYVKNALKTAASYAEQNDYKTASGVLSRALKIMPENTVLSDELSSLHYREKEYVIRTTKEYVNECLRKSDFPGLIQKLIETLELYDDAELAALLEKYKEEYGERIVQTAEELFQSEGYDAAMAVLNDVKTTLRDNPLITDLAESLNRRKPVSLFTVEPYKTTNPTWLLTYYPTEKDALGNEYSNVYINGGNYLLLAPGSAGAKYYINGEYTSLTGMIAMRSADAKGGYIEVIGDDGSALYTSPIITGEDGTLAFEVNLTNVKFMTLYIHSGYATDPWDCNEIMLIDFQLKKV